MEQLLDLEFDTTQHFVWREHEWGIFMSVSVREGGGVDLDVEFLNREMPVIATLRSFPLTLEKGACLEMERLDGSEDEVTISLEERDASGVVLRLQVPEGVQWELFKDDDDVPEG